MLIALVGIDGAGKSTIARLLAQRMRGRGEQVVLTSEPYTTRWGQWVRSGMGSLQDSIVDRVFHVAEVIRPGLASGCVVITDRYYACTAAYQEPDADMAHDLMRRMRRAFPRPDLTVHVMTDLDECCARLDARGESYQHELLERADRRYRSFDMAPLLVVSGTGGAERAVQSILDTIGGRA
jgi:dTMP kinase